MPIPLALTVEVFVLVTNDVSLFKSFKFQTFARVFKY